MKTLRVPAVIFTALVKFSGPDRTGRDESKQTKAVASMGWPSNNESLHAMLLTRLMAGCSHIR